MNYLARLHGYVSGDGSAGFYSYPYKKSKAHLNIKIDDQACLSKILEAFAVLGYSPSIMRSRSRYGEWYTVQAQKDGIVREVLSLGPVGSYNWRVPSLEKQQWIREWIAAFFDSEATVTCQNKEITIESVNRTGLNQINAVLAGVFHVSSHVRFRKIREVYLLRICGKANLEGFWENIGFNHKQKQRKLHSILESYQKYYGDTWSFPEVANKQMARDALIDLFMHRGYFRIKAGRYGSFELGLHHPRAIAKITNALQTNFDIHGAISTAPDKQGRCWIWISRLSELKKLLHSRLLRKAPEKEKALRDFITRPRPPDADSFNRTLIIKGK